MTSLTNSYIPFSEIDKRLAARTPLYIRNRTSKPMKVLVINYPSAEDPHSGFNIPRTSIPFNICDYVDPESLRASKSFRTMLNGGHIEVVKEEAAVKELSDPERVKAFRIAFEEANNTYKARSGEQEKSRLASQEVRNEQLKNQSGAMKNMLASMDPTLAKAIGALGADGQRPLPKLQEERSTRLTALEGRIKNGSIDSSGVMTELSLMLGDLTQTDLEFIAANPSFPHEAQEWARGRLSFALRGTVEMP